MLEVTEVADLDQEFVGRAFRHLDLNGAGLREAVRVLDGIRACLVDSEKQRLLEGFVDRVFVKPASHGSSKFRELGRARWEPTLIVPLGDWVEPDGQHDDVVRARLVDSERDDQRGADVIDRGICDILCGGGEAPETVVETLVAAFDQPVRVQHEQGAWFEDR